MIVLFPMKFDVFTFWALIKNHDALYIMLAFNLPFWLHCSFAFWTYGHIVTDSADICKLFIFFARQMLKVVST